MTTPIDVLITVKLKPAIIERLEAVSTDVHLRIHPAERERDIPNKAWQNADVLLLFGGEFLPPLTLNTKLRWIHSFSAGVDSLLKNPYLEAHPEILVTNSSGMHAAKIGEFVIGMILALGHRIPTMLSDQREQKWTDDRYKRLLPRELSQSTVGIVGYGRIGREIARLCKAFGATVLATKRDVRNPKDDRYTLPGKGDPEGDLADRLYPPEATKFMIKECDFVVITLPLTDTTRGSFDAETIKAMKPSAALINIGRGGVVDEAALVEALNEGRLAGAAFDVFEAEPLPPTNPLWTAKNMIISPHVSGNMVDYQEKAAAIFEENLRRFVEGRPLMNTVNRQLGY